jgi:hypothetical protein
MPSAKSGEACQLVKPAEPREAKEADDADPGQVEEPQAADQNEQPPSKPYKRDPKKKGWIEIVLIDESDRPVPGIAYEITTPDGSVASGTLDDKGFARVDGFDSGECKVSFTQLDKEAWEPA